MKTLALIAILLSPSLIRAAEIKPNFVFLLVDDLGWGDFGCYGASFNETPRIDQLADEGVRFTAAYSACTVCSPSRSAILTGCYPARTRLTDFISGHQFPHAKLSVPDWNMRIDHQRVVLPEALKEAGYQTAFFGKWHLMPKEQDDFDQHYPTNHGFDLNVGGREWGAPSGPGRYFSPFDMPNLDDGQAGDYLTDKLTDAAIDFLDSTSREQPFLLYFSYYTLHGPIMSPPALAKKYKDKAEGFDNRSQEHLDPKRAGMVESLDTSIGRILDKLNELGIADNTAVILTGDNGGNYAGTSGGLKGYKGFSHEGGVRQPFIVKWPGHSKAGSISDELVIGTDIYPTMLEMAGLPQRPDHHQDGISIVPALTSPGAGLGRKQLYWHYPHYHRTKPYGATRHGDWKLIEFFEDGQLELYNLRKDPNETTNLVKTHPEKAKALLKELKAWRESVDAQMMSANPNYDPDKAELKAKSKRKAAGKRK